jgi:hypothetical protein
MNAEFLLNNGNLLISISGNLLMQASPHSFIVFPL